MNDPSPTSWLERLMGWAFGTLLAAMAVYGAVTIVSSVWVQLCIGLTVIALVALAAWLIARRTRGW